MYYAEDLTDMTYDEKAARDQMTGLENILAASKPACPRFGITSGFPLGSRGNKTIQGYGHTPSLSPHPLEDSLDGGANATQLTDIIAVVHCTVFGVRSEIQNLVLGCG